MTSAVLPPAIIIGGPTASGKSGLALRLARDFGGLVINADSMQVYDGLPILTAQPSADDQAVVPHRLYGVLPSAEVCSAERWRDMAAAEMAAAWALGRLPIVVGGTGLYLRTLMEGLSPIPDTPDAIRTAARAELAEMGNQAFHDRLAGRDPEMAARLAVGDSQRMARAWEVLEATGRSLSAWQAAPRVGAVPARWHVIALMPPRPLLNAACDGRFDAMIAAGALDEVQDFIALGLDPALPIMKALGLRELAATLNGTMERGAAIRQAQQATRNYAKRQMTWLRHQLNASDVVCAQFSESFIGSTFLKVRQFLLTTS